MSGLRDTSLGTIVRRVATLAVLLSLLAAPAGALAQDSPFTRTSFTSAKFGTEITWTRDWAADRDESRVEQRRDLIALASRTADAAVLIELQSQRSFRTAEALLNTAMERYANLEGFEQTSEDLGAYPPSLQFEFGVDEDTFAGHIQAQVIEGAMMAVIVLALPGELDEAMELANTEIQVNGVPLLDALPVCGEAAEATATATATESASSGGDNKTSGFGSSSSQASNSGDCVEMFVPTPSSDGDGTPEPTPTATAASGRGSGLNNVTYTSPTFPGVSLQYNKGDWEVSDERTAEENNGRDLLLLNHAELPAVLYAETYAGHNGRASACIDLALGEAGISPGTDAPLEDENGELIQGSTQGHVWGAYAYELTVNDQTFDAGGYVECRALPGAAGVLVISMIVLDVDQFDAAYQDLQPILQSVVLG